MTEKDMHQCILDHRRIEISKTTQLISATCFTNRDTRCLCTVCRTVKVEKITRELKTLSSVKTCLTCGNIRVMPEDRKAGSGDYAVDIRVMPEDRK